MFMSPPTLWSPAADNATTAWPGSRTAGGALRTGPMCTCWQVCGIGPRPSPECRNPCQTRGPASRLAHARAPGSRRADARWSAERRRSADGVGFHLRQHLLRGGTASARGAPARSAAGRRSPGWPGCAPPRTPRGSVPPRCGPRSSEAVGLGLRLAGRRRQLLGLGARRRRSRCSASALASASSSSALRAASSRQSGHAARGGLRVGVRRRPTVRCLAPLTGPASELRDRLARLARVGLGARGLARARRLGRVTTLRHQFLVRTHAVPQGSSPCLTRCRRQGPGLPDLPARRPRRRRVMTSVCQVRPVVAHLRGS